MPLACLDFRGTRRRRGRGFNLGDLEGVHALVCEFGDDFAQRCGNGPGFCVEIVRHGLAALPYWLAFREEGFDSLGGVVTTGRDHGHFT